MAGTGFLVTFETARLVGIPHNGIRISPFGFLAPSFPPVTLCRLFIGVTITSRPRLPMPQRRCWDIQASFLVVRVFSSTPLPRFTGPESSVLSVNLPPSDPYPLRDLLSRVRFSNVYCSFQRQVRRASLGKTHHLPISRPTSLRFGPPDIRSCSLTPARPPPRCHIVGSLFATYMGSASCFLRTAHYWNQPLPCWRCPSVR